MKDHDEQPIETASVPTYLSLCSGYDGIGIALKRVIPELRTIAHVEIEAFAIANLVTKMEEGKLDSAPVFTDIKRFPFEDLRERQPTILSAGFPCQPFSSAGKRQATDDPRHLWPFIADGITACRPSYCFLENVDGIVSSKTADGESVLLYVLRDLEERGYTCSWGTFSAAEIGAPHLRKRVFILAKLADGESIERQRTESIGDRCERPEETVGSSSSYVADGVSKGLEGHAGDVNETTGQTGRGTHRPISESGLSRTVYPSRPGERQCSWEEPRVVGGELVNAEHDGSPRPSTGRRSGQASDGSAQGTDETGEPSGASGREDVSNLQGGERGELADAKSGESGKSQAGNRREDTGGGSEISERERAIDAGREATNSEEEYVGNASSERSHRGSEDCTDVEPEVLGTGHEESYVSEADPSEAQSELGGTTDGTARGVDAIVNRTDRLRLLGNGVVPDCAELAFRTLFNQLHNNKQ